MKAGQNDDENQPKIWSVGHSNKLYFELARLLKSAAIQTVVDCRTRPYSRWPQFGRERLTKLLEADGIVYEFRGSNIGGYDTNEAESETLDELAERAASGERIALLCSEGKPQDCHRGQKLAPELESRNVIVEHLLYATPQRALL